MDKGEVIAHGTKEKLKVSISIGATVTNHTNKEPIYIIRHKEYVLDISYKQNELRIQTKKGNSYLPTILDILEKNKMPIGRVYTELPTLNDVFLKLTGKELRD